jgi:hypothetical protein
LLRHRCFQFLHLPCLSNCLSASHLCDAKSHNVTGKVTPEIS